ncbi:hypothetical protein BDY19DRAFT_987807 [Irpex rosettiformis]|uniref:Uncharacterized protein n=1 Tax=Irpex rosettiformis TaxID=378272 RepID=A0ACB8TP27_9APHY|nr:hypothetical protein BDY19DRAFT_987807 [Irpex rosettiformis]
MNALPQHGFGSEVAFDNLLPANPFLYRVYTPRSPLPQDGSSEPYFVGSKFSDGKSADGFQSSAAFSAGASGASTYADVAQHMDWTTRAASPFISTSFSFAWALWEAIRRYHTGIKHNVEIAVIDARAVADRSTTAVELLMKASSKERHKDHWKWYRFALESQDVLVWGHIPGTAILASIPLLQILNRLPSYFLCHNINDAKDSPLFRLGWDFAQKKPNYRQFCQVISERFLQMPVEKRLRDTTAGSVRLAIALLRPYFHKHISDDFTAATLHVYNLSYVIAQWPGQWWSREHLEIRDLIRHIVHLVGEEMREAKRVQALADATRMEKVVGGLQQFAQSYDTRSRPRKHTPALPLSPAPSPSPTLPPSPTTQDHKLRLTAVDIIVDDMTDTEESTIAESDAMEKVEEDVEKIVAEEMKYPALANIAPFPPPASSGRTFEKVARTTSCLITGFLVGSFIALCVLAPDRRQLAHHIT